MRASRNSHNRKRTKIFFFLTNLRQRPKHFFSVSKDNTTLIGEC